jgi:general secretion pathway protein K
MTSTRQQGVAVVTALLLTTLAITIVASLFWQQQVQVRSIENQRLQLQKQWILLGAIDWARLILREDARNSGVDYKGEPWSTPLAETRLDAYVDDGRNSDANDATLSGYITDAQARFNLTNLCVNGTIVPTEVAVFARLLSSQQINPDLAMAAAQLKAAAQRKPDSSATSDSQPLDITQPDDLLAVSGFTPDMLAKLRNFVVALPRITPVNMNTASPEVMAATIDTLPLPDAIALGRSRDAAYFRDQSDLLQRLQGKSLSQASGDIAFASAYFIVSGKVRLNRATLDVQALIERLGSQTKVIWIRES